MKTEKVTKLTEETKTAFTGTLPVQTVYLHSAIMIDGRTEATLNKGKIPTIISMEWTDNGFLIVNARTRHILPAAAVKDSIG